MKVLGILLIFILSTIIATASFIFGLLVVGPIMSSVSEELIKEHEAISYSMSGVDLEKIMMSENRFITDTNVIPPVVEYLPF